MITVTPFERWRNRGSREAMSLVKRLQHVKGRSAIQNQICLLGNRSTSVHVPWARDVCYNEANSHSGVGLLQVRSAISNTKGMCSKKCTCARVYVHAHVCKKDNWVKREEWEPGRLTKCRTLGEGLSQWLASAWAQTDWQRERGCPSETGGLATGRVRGKGKPHLLGMSAL